MEMNHQTEVCADAYVSINERDPILHKDYAFSEAITHIKRSRGKTFFLHAEAIVRLPRPSGTTERMPVGGTIILSKPQLLNFLNKAIPDSMRPDWKIQIGECSDCLFVGGF